MRFVLLRITPFVFLLAITPFDPVAAQLYTCVDGGGTTVFSDRPCGADAEVIDQPDAPMIGTRSVKSSRPPGPSLVVGPLPPSAAQSAKARDREYRCSVKRKALEDLNARLRRGYSRSEGEALKRQRESVELYLETYCE